MLVKVGAGGMHGTFVSQFVKCECGIETRMESPRARFPVSLL
jgi:hypothetical protein